jgi:hypothetical protein
VKGTTKRRSVNDLRHCPTVKVDSREVSIGSVRARRPFKQWGHMMAIPCCRKMGILEGSAAGHTLSFEIPAERSVCMCTYLNNYRFFLSFVMSAGTSPCEYLNGYRICQVRDISTLSKFEILSHPLPDHHPDSIERMSE